MSECCPPKVNSAANSSCGSASADDAYQYAPQPFVTGELSTFGGAVSCIATELTERDRRGGVRVRLGFRRSDYRVKPGLYAIGEPDDTAPVLVTANYKLTFDTLRSELKGRSLWLLVLDTKGVNVWCAAGKGTFGTDELVSRIRAVRLEQVVSHRTLVLPQLGATGVAGHAVRAGSGFSVAWGPVRAADLPAFLDAGNQATPRMRRVSFTLRERAKLTGVELSVLWRSRTLVALAFVAVLAVAAGLGAPSLVGVIGFAAASALAAVVAGAFVVPVLLPWIPGRTFALKGALVGALAVAAVALAFADAVPKLALAGLSTVAVAIASYVAMNFTGASTFTSPSGVEWEMRRVIPWQLAGLFSGVVVTLAGVVFGWRA